MLQAATSTESTSDGGGGSGDRQPSLLSFETFSRALIADTDLYDMRNEARLTTNCDDVFLNRNRLEDWELHDDIEEGDEIQSREEVAASRESISTRIPRRWAAPCIDMVAGTYRSKSLFVALWAAFTVTYLGFYQEQGLRTAADDMCEGKMFYYGGSWMKNSAAMYCHTGKSVAEWLVVFVYVRYVVCGQT